MGEEVAESVGFWFEYGKEIRVCHFLHCVSATRRRRRCEGQAMEKPISASIWAIIKLILKSMALFFLRENFTCCLFNGFAPVLRQSRSGRYCHQAFSANFWYTFESG